MNCKSVLENIVSISDLTRGSGSKVLKKVADELEPCIVVKNNKPHAVIVSVEEYKQLLEIKENMELLELAKSRVQGNKPKEAELISFETILEQHNIKESELDLDSVEIE